MAGNTTTKKSFNKILAAPPMAQVQRTVTAPNKGPQYDGQLSGSTGHQPFAEPLNKGAPAKIGGGLDKTYDDIGERSGFITDGYLDKQGTPYGEAAKFNFLPPGMDISNQENAEINKMPMRTLVDVSYPGDGWMPSPRDITE